jgi:hypothetical protein
VLPGSAFLRLVFFTYLGLIVFGLAYFLAIGIVNR